MSRRPRLTRGELKKKEELEHLSLVEEVRMGTLGRGMGEVGEPGIWGNGEG